MSKIAEIEYWWDTQDASNAGWYARAFDAAGDIIDDSSKVWWRVDMDEYAEDDLESLGEALRDAYPEAEVVPP